MMSYWLTMRMSHPRQQCRGLIEARSPARATRASGRPAIAYAGPSAIRARPSSVFGPAASLARLRTDQAGAARSSPGTAPRSVFPAHSGITHVKPQDARVRAYWSRNPTL